MSPRVSRLQQSWDSPPPIPKTPRLITIRKAIRTAAETKQPWARRPVVRPDPWALLARSAALSRVSRDLQRP